MRLVTLVLALALAAPARAAEMTAPADTAARVAAEPDTAALVAPLVRAAADSATTAADTTARARRRGAPARRGLFEQPRFVMLRSALVPGWGQLHNGSWVKAIGVAAVESWLAVKLRDDWRALDDLSAQADRARAANDIEGENALIERYNARLDTSVRRQWLLAGALTYALLDAYVDAHFRDFRFEFETDPALPGGSGRGGARVSIGWGF